MASTKKKKKRILTIVILLAVLAVIGILFAVLTMMDKKSSEEAAGTEESGVSLIDVSKDDLASLTFTTPDYTITADWDGENWTYEQNPDIPLYATRVNSVFTAGSVLTSTMTVDDTMANAANFGLDNSDYTIHFTLKDGTTVGGTIGMLNTYNNSYYFNLDGTDEIYMVNVGVMTNMDHPVSWFYQFEGYDQLYDFQDIEGFEISNANMHNVFTKYPHSNYEASWYCFTWFYEDDGELHVSDPQYTSTYMEELATLQTDECVEYQADADTLASYGITEDSPYVTIQVDMAGEAAYTETETEAEETEASDSDEEEEIVLTPRTYRIGNPVPTDDDSESSYYYVSTDDTGNVFTASKETIDYVLDAKLTDFVNLEFGLIQISNVTEMKLELEGETYDFTFVQPEATAEDDDPDQEFYLDGTQIDSKTFKSFYTKVIGIWGDRAMTDEDEVIDGDSYMTITYTTTLEHFPVLTVELRYYDNNYYQATVNGKTEVLVNKNDLTIAIEELDSMLAELQ